MSKKYNRTFRLKIAKEAILPENEGLEDVIAEKYGILPSTVSIWKMHYIEYGDESFKEGISNKKYKTTREIQLEKEREELLQEIEILKKAKEFFTNLNLK
jgi:transposase